MKIAISNIAWEPAENEVVWKILQERGVVGLEVAPSLVGPEFAQKISDYDLQVVAAQALLFGRSDLVLFGSEETRVALLEHLCKVVDLLQSLGGSVAIFGSPKNRLTNGLPPEVAEGIAVDFFRTLGYYAAKKGIAIALEPNPVGYGADFVNTTAEAVALAKLVNSPGFVAHLDVGSLIMNGEDPVQTTTLALPWIKHVHVSAPLLAPLDAQYEVVHRTVAEVLRANNFSGWVSVEMKKGDAGSNIPTILTALDFVQSIYG